MKVNNYIYTDSETIKNNEDILNTKRVSIILCKLIDEFSKFNALPFYLHKNFYTLFFIYTRGQDPLLQDIYFIKF